MNKHVLLVLKWINDNDSVNFKQIKNNKNESILLIKGEGAERSAAAAVYYASAGLEDIYEYGDVRDDEITYWIDEYFRLSGENRADYNRQAFMDIHGLGEDDMRGGEIFDVS